MSELLAPFGAPPEVVEEPDETAHTVAAASVGVTDEPVVITEQQVLFATAAAAVPLQPVKTRGWVSRVIGSIVAAASVTSGNDDRPKRQHYPPRYDFLESSRMAREMHRL
jgi:hypothetical protein